MYPFYPAHPSNYTAGRGGKSIKYFTIHHIAGAPQTLRYLWADPNRNGSSHYGVFPTKIEQYVSEKNTAWTNGNFSSNQESITIENYGTWLNGYRNDQVLAQLKKLLTDLHKRYPHAKLNFHQDVSLKPTACPGELRHHATRIFNEITNQTGGTMFENDSQIQAMYYLIRGKNATSAEVAGWRGKKIMDFAMNRYAKQEVANREAHTANLAKQVTTLTTQVNNLTAQVNTLSAQVKQLSETVKSKDSEITKLKGEVATSQDTVQLNALGEALKWLLTRLGLK
jgi:outer membrane murein-binding lipoprotein Lpp